MGKSIPFRRALYIAATYLSLGVLWIFFSDNLLLSLFPESIYKITSFQTYKGWFFVIFTAFLIFLLTYAALKEKSEVFKKLLESEMEFRTLVEESLVGVYIIQDGKFLYINPQLQQTFGYTTEELVAFASILEVVHEEDRGLIETNLQKHITGEIQSIRYTFRCRHKNGHILHVEVHDSRIEWNGKPAVIGTLLDITERKNVEEALQFTQFAVDNFAEPAFRIRANGKIIDVNKAACRYLGYSQGELQSMTVSEINPDFPPEVWPEHWQKMKDLGSMTFESYHKTKSGQVIPVEIHTSHIQYQNEEYIWAYVYDITERKRVEEALYESENKYRTLFEKSADAILIIEGDKFVDCNIATIEMFGYKNKKYFLGTHPSASELSPEIQPDGKKSFEKANEILSTVFDQESIRFEWDHKRQNGEVFPAEVVLTPVPFGERKFIHCVLRDITERKLAEQALKKNEEKLSKIFNATPDSVAISRLNDGLVMYINPAFTNIFKYTSEEVLGKTTFDLNVWARVENREVLIRELKEKGQAINFETEFRMKGGEFVPVSVSASIIEIEDEKCVVSTFRDISDRKQAEKQLLKSRESLRNLATRLQTIREQERTQISREIHDELGQSLTGVRIDLKWIQDHLSTDDKEVEERVQMALLLVDDLLDTVQELSHKLRPAILDDMGLGAAIESHIKEYSQRTGCHCELEMEINDMNVDKKRDTAVFRILQESLTNVARHAGANRLTVSLRTENGRLFLEISDNGRGITQEMIEDSESIGLIGMRERAEMLGGHLDIRRRKPEGTQVRLDIPPQRD